MAPFWSMMIIAALTLALASGPAMADDDEQIMAETQGMLDKIAADIARGDIPAVLAYDVDGCTINYLDGRSLEMAQWGKNASADRAQWRDVKSSFTVERAWPIGSDHAGIVYAEQHDFSRIDDPGHAYAIKARFEAELVKTPQGWRFLKLTEKDGQVLRDGRPFTPNAAPKQ